MPIDYKLEKNGALVLANATGVLGVNCFLAMQERMRAEPELRSPHSTLLDVRCVTDIQITEADLETIAKSLSAGPRKLGAQRLAIVAPQTRAFRLGARYGEIEKDVRENVIVFYDMSAARIWLGLADPSSTP
jgi:hypothetical protein